jgi:hypothetical protein
MKTLIIVLSVIGFILMLTLDAMGQPGLPSGPSQAPIDGGLVLVAAAGGVYAWKKLKKKT